MSCPEPLGAFYVYPSVEGVLGKEIRGQRPATSAELCELILDEVEVAVVPGEAFGTPGYLRLSYALGDDDLVEGVGRLAQAARRGPELGSATERRQRWDATSARCPRPTCTCTSPASMRPRDAARAGRPSTASGCPTRCRGLPRRRELRATDERGWFRFQRLYDAARVGAAHARPTSAGWCARRPQDDARGGLGLAGDPGRPDRLRAALRRADRRPSSSCWTPRGDAGDGDRRRGRR